MDIDLDIDLDFGTFGFGFEWVWECIYLEFWWGMSIVYLPTYLPSLDVE